MKNEFNIRKDPIVKATVAVIIEKENKILITKRSERQNKEPNKWCLPGGHIDIGEKAITTAEREIKEEIGLKIKNPKFIKYIDEYLPKIKIHAIVLLFHAKNFSGNLKKNPEVSDTAWISKAEMKNYKFAFTHKKILEDFFK